MTLPMSVWATRSSITVTFSPATSFTFTLSTSSTSAFAMCSTNSRMNHDSHLRLLCAFLDVVHQPLHRVRGLRPLGDPLLRLRPVDLDRRRFGQGVVVPDDLDEAPVARRARVRHHHPVARPPRGSRPSQSNRDRHCSPPQIWESGQLHPWKLAGEPLELPHHLPELRVLLEEPIHVLHARA